jgi:hypothetical protein
VTAGFVRGKVAAGPKRLLGVGDREKKRERVRKGGRHGRLALPTPLTRLATLTALSRERERERRTKAPLSRMRERGWG